MKTIYRIGIGKVGIVELDEEKVGVDKIGKDEVLVAGRICGICKSDVETVLGLNNIPVEMFGHEGVGEVIEVGDNVKEFEVGDYVASWWHPAYADKYKGTEDKFAKVKDISEQYIVQPLATMVNVVYGIFDSGYRKGMKVMVRGSGANAMLLCMAMKEMGVRMEDVVFVGSGYNREFFERYCRYENDVENDSFDIVVDVSGKRVYNWIIDKVKENGVIVAGANPRGGEKIDLFKYSWKAVKVIFPSPRSKKFIDAFRYAAELLNRGKVDNVVVFEKGYERDNAQKGFDDSMEHRIVKGYLYW